jgi:DNA repair exonuclease SbcCD ATPase subunit
MLNIQKIKFKNILSAGNTFTELSFIETNTTLIVGSNGNGKSLLITALIFALYGKSNRGTTKTQLVNSINKKDCLVEVDFCVRNKQYKVVRGISPNVFEIWIDGVLQDQLSSAKDQQKYLEQIILRMSYKTFIQVVVLGSSNFIPFMQLSSGDRRELVEELLDIKVFSSMNTILKDEIKSLERKIQELTYNKTSISEKIEMQKKFIDTLTKNGEDLLSNKANKITSLEAEIEIISKTNDDNTISIGDIQDKIKDLSNSSKKLKQLENIRGKLDHKKALIQDQINFFSNNDSCPTCKQNLHVDFKETECLTLNEELSNLSEGYLKLELALTEEETRENKFLEYTNNITNLTHEISNNQKFIKQFLSQIQTLQTEIKETEYKLKNQNEDKKILYDLIKNESSLNVQTLKYKDALQYFEFSHSLMKDGGIKSKIIQKYLPMLNQYINKYLQLMDFYINFTLDEEFNESVRTPIHEDFSYGSFSEGEKQKLNLSILFAWRDIAKMKNSINCNLLILDETFDSSLDSAGSEYLIKILNHVIKDTNIFVISHRIDELVDKFDRVLEVKKVNGFSKILT